MEEEYPLLTALPPDLLDSVDALLELFAGEEPLVLPVRPTGASKLRYFAADASAEGFGSAMQYPSGATCRRDGLWMPAFAEGGSNLREATAQVNHILSDVREGRHDGCEVWCATDNAVWSHIWHKGMSSARHLFRLVLDLKLACHEHEVHLFPFHISGDRMIACGIDGWSRGNHDMGVSLGHDLRPYFPLDRGAFEQEGTRLETWCRSWMGTDYAPPLEPRGWFWEGHKRGVHIWAPPPAAARVALAELAMSRYKRPYEVTHVFLCQRLLWQEEWRRRFEKEMDVWFLLHCGSAWPNHNFEPLLVGISFPMSRSRPWLVRQLREQVVEVGRALSEVSKTRHVEVGNHLRELWLHPREVPETLRRRMVREVFRPTLP